MTTFNVNHRRMKKKMAAQNISWLNVALNATSTMSGLQEQSEAE
jgi:hypothetical protein